MDRVRSGSPYEARNGYCRARRVGDRILVAGTGPTPPDGEQVAEGARAQLLRCATIALQAVEDLGGRRQDVVRTRMYVSDRAVVDEVGLAHAEVFAEAEPVATLVICGLVEPSWLVELEVEAIGPA